MTNNKKNTTNLENEDARLHHLANTFKLYKEKKLNFFYPENDNRDYTEEEEEMLLRARVNGFQHTQFADKYDAESRDLAFREYKAKNVELKVLGDHNIYLDEEKLKEIEQKELHREICEDELETQNKQWGVTIFYALAESISKLLRK